MSEHVLILQMHLIKITYVNVHFCWIIFVAPVQVAVLLDRDEGVKWEYWWSQEGSSDSFQQNLARVFAT